MDTRWWLASDKPAALPLESSGQMLSTESEMSQFAAPLPTNEFEIPAREVWTRRTIVEATLRSDSASRDLAPCRNAPFRSPEGAPEPAAPPCSLHRRLPLTAGQRQDVPALVRAWQSGAFVSSGKRPSLGLAFGFSAPPVIMHMLV